MRYERIRKRGGYLYFIFNGGFSKNFNAGLQKEELPNVKGTVPTVTFETNPVGTGSLSIVSKGKSMTGSTDVSTYGRKIGLDLSKGQTDSSGNIMSSSVYKDGGHVTPENYTVRVWQRTD